MRKIRVGTDNKNDCSVELYLGKKQAIHIESKTMGMFDEHIKGLIKSLLTEYGIKHAHVTVNEKGALDYVIKARVEAAINHLPNIHPHGPPMKRKPSTKDRVRRTRLYIPGNNPRMIASAGIYGSDCLIFDLEDSVPVDQKKAARFLVKNALCDLDFGASEIWVRVNKGEMEQDLATISPGGPHGICLPKVESAADIRRSEEILNGDNRKTLLMPIIESAQGVMHLSEIAQASTRVVALAFGAEDLSRDLGGTRSWDTLFYARSALVTTAKAHGIQALDTIYPDVRDEQGLRRETEKIVAMGFDGKGVIHPEQIEPIHDCFTPSKEDIENALAIIEALRVAQKKGLGVASLNGKMIDEPVEKRARKILKMARGT